jgi:hypothetical protein
MSNESLDMNDAQLDAALDRLQPPMPSETLVARVQAMAPTPQRAMFTPRRAAAAALVVALGAATLLQMTDPQQNAPASQPVAAIADPAGEIPVSDLALADETTTLPTEPFSVAGMPLE